MAMPRKMSDAGDTKYIPSHMEKDLFARRNWNAADLSASKDSAVTTSPMPIQVK